MIKAFLLSLLFVVPAFAGPPEDAKKLMIPFPVVCTPGMTSMMGALTTDYAVHISMKGWLPLKRKCNRALRNYDERG